MGAETQKRSRTDFLLAVVVVAILALMVFPLPLPLLDALLSLNLAVAALLLLSALLVPTPLSLATFPTVLLVTTLLRLALDVAATRLILGRGDGGAVVRAFGHFVVAGNYVVGMVVFAVVTLVQFLVLARGAERVSEVAARFALDALPGKQMAVDAELRAGAIDAAEARRQRRELAREASFHGAMDGAMKFVKGDAIAGLVITAVNLLGGFAVGVGQRGMAPGEVLRVYGLLTIGQGLVSQVPALLVATAAGLLVTRVAPEGAGSGLGSELARELGARSAPLGLAAVLLVLFALTPGLPTGPFLLLALGLGALAWALARKRKRALSRGDELGAPAREGATRGEGAVARVEPVTLELGAGLRWLVEGDAPLRALVVELRAALFRSTGLAMPTVRVALTAALPEHTLRITVLELEACVREVPEGCALVVGEPPEQGPSEREPERGAAAVWLPEPRARELGAQGFAWLNAPEYVTALLGAELRRHAHRFVGIAEVQALLDALEGEYAGLVRHAVPRPLSVALLANVLRRLAQERVSVRDLRALLEALVVAAGAEREAHVLSEIARCAVRATLCHALASGTTLRVWLLAPELQERLAAALVAGDEGVRLALSQTEARALADEVMLQTGSERVVLLTVASLRRALWEALAPQLEELSVLAPEELASGLAVQIEGELTW